jgi:hypothetical protein
MHAGTAERSPRRPCRPGRELIQPPARRRQPPQPINRRTPVAPAKIIVTILAVGITSFVETDALGLCSGPLNPT